MYLNTYKIFFSFLFNARSVKGKNQEAERTSAISSAVLKLYSSHTDPFFTIWIQPNWMNSVIPPEYPVYLYTPIIMICVFFSLDK